MALKTTITWHNAGPHTIWGKLAARLGREPTNEEAIAEVKRILSDAPVPRTAKEILHDADASWMERA